MSDQNSPSPSRRRSSIVDMFTSRPSFSNINNPNSSAVSSSPPASAVPPSPNTPQHRRGTSITALGLTTTSSNQNQSIPFGAFARQRRASVTTSSSGSPEFRNSFGDEPAVIEDEESPKSPGNNRSPLGRRLSFGAQALRDVKQGNSPGSPGAGEGFNWSEALRDRTKRSPSFSSGNPFSGNAVKPRTTSPTTVEPPKAMPKPQEPAPKLKKPDHLGERMLRGDFMMD